MHPVSTNLMAASRQWAIRPNDERFWSIADLQAAMKEVKASGSERTPYVRSMRALAFDEPGYDTPDLRIGSTSGGPTIKLTHWSLGQLARYSAAPAEYIRSLPAPLAAECLNHGLAARGDQAASILLHRNPDTSQTLRSMTTERYSRLWNADLVNALTPAIDNGWIIPPARPTRDDSRARAATLADIVPGQDAFGLSVKVGDMISPAGVYASDHDMFLFMVNPDRVLDMNGSRGLMRGIFLWNSEVGAGAFKVQTFLLEAVCGNHIVWGASDVRTFRKVHKGNNFSDMGSFGRDMSRSLVAYADRDTTVEMGMVKAAPSYFLGKDEAETKKALFANKSLGLSQTVIDVTYTVAEKWEHTAQAPPTTAWGFVHGLTRYSQETPYADERAKLDTAAGKLLALASN
jgi:hypothetical protein